MESIQRNLAPLALRHQLSLVLPFSSATGLAYPALPDLAPSALRRQVSLALPNFFINNIVLCQQNFIPLLSLALLMPNVVPSHTLLKQRKHIQAPASPPFCG